MQCNEPDCSGDVVNGVCQCCGAAAGAKHATGEVAALHLVIDSVRSLLLAPGKDELMRASDSLRTVHPYNFEAWRLHADVLLSAIRQLEIRELQPDENVQLFTIPLREDALRDAAEAALRQCAHFADGAEKRIAIVDEANKVRRMTWV